MNEKLRPPTAQKPDGRTGIDDTRQLWKWVLVAVLLMSLGTLLARYVLTLGGTVEVRDVRWVGSNGDVLSAFLYIPNGVNAKNPVAAIAIGEGGDSSKENFEAQAIELARRGFVVLGLDQTGWGYSSGFRGQNAYGGRDALTYLRTLDFVDKSNIGLAAHSQGSNFLNGAWAAYPDGYKALFYLSNSPGTNITDTVVLKKLRNVAVSMGAYDEYSNMSYRAATGGEVPQSAHLKALFGVTETVVPGKLYGSIEDGSARLLYLTPNTHVSAMEESGSVGTMIDWFQKTLKTPKPLPITDQIAAWKDWGAALASLGFLILIFPIGALLLKLPYFSTLADPTPEYKGFTGGRWWFGAIVTVAITVLTYFWSTSTASSVIKVNPFWPQSTSNTYIFWFGVVGCLTILFVVINHLTFGRPRGATGVNYGLTWAGTGLDWGKIGKSLLLAICIMIPMYLCLAIAYGTTLIDFRGPVNFFAMRVLSPERIKAFLGYVLPFALLYVPLSASLHGFLRWKDGRVSFTHEWIANAVMLTIGIVGLLLVEYIPYFFVYAKLPVAPGGSGFWIVRLYSLVILLPFVSGVSTFFFRKTGHIWVGAFLNTMFITWFVIGQQSFDAIIW